MCTFRSAATMSSMLCRVTDLWVVLAGATLLGCYLAGRLA